ncbi:XRE family transcriptional regulator [Psychrobacillus sp. FSL K6-2843]|jgi:repressor LexA|uniref:LexA family protein n=1 Tax=Psychrobacillus sp. FSL K6-2843 TaxID=2921549 RepID=UPI00315B3AFD
MRTTGEIIKELREAHGLSKQRLAELLDLKSYTTVSKWEVDENHPRGKEIKMLCTLFNISADYLLGLKDENVIPLFNYKYIPSSISAGLPLTVDTVADYECETIALPDNVMGKWARNKDVFFLKVNGDSMNKIFPNDALIGVKMISLSELNDKDIVVFNYDNEYSVKRFMKNERANKLIFRPESNDETFTDIVIEEEQKDLVQIVGKVVVYIVTA